LIRSQPINRFIFVFILFDLFFNSLVFSRIFGNFVSDKWKAASEISIYGKIVNEFEWFFLKKTIFVGNSEKTVTYNGKRYKS